MSKNFLFMNIFMYSECFSYRLRYDAMSFYTLLWLVYSVLKSISIKYQKGY